MEYFCYMVFIRNTTSLISSLEMGSCIFIYGTMDNNASTSILIIIVRGLNVSVTRFLWQMYNDLLVFTKCFSINAKLYKNKITHFIEQRCLVC